MTHCATSNDEFTIGQHVGVVCGLGCVEPAVVIDITPLKIVVAYNGSDRVGFHRFYELLVDPTQPIQGELFGITELFGATT